MTVYRKMGGDLTLVKGQVTVNRNEAFRDRLRTAVKGASETQGQIAKTLDVREATVSAWLQRGGPLPGGEYLIRLPEILGVSADWLITGRGPMHPASDEDALRLEIVGIVARRDLSVDELQHVLDAIRPAS